MRKKKTINNKLFSLYLVVLFLFLTALFIFREQPVYIEINLTLKTPNCDFGEIYFNSGKQISLESKNHIRLNLEKNQNFNQYRFSLPTPVNYFRLDPCEKMQETGIKALEVIYEGKSTFITLRNISQWTCVNCVFEEKDDYLGVKARSTDPIIVTSDFGNEIPMLKVPPSQYREKLFLLATLFLLACPVFIIILWSTNKFIIFEAIFYFLGETILAAFLTLNYFEKIKNWFLPPKIGANKIIGYTHYFGYPTNFDLAIFLVFVVSPIFILGLVKLRKAVARGIKRK